MLPWFGECAILGLEPVTSTAELQRGDCALYLKGDGTVCHQVLDLTPDAALFGGVHNKRNDGWVKLTLIKWRVAALFYCKP